MVLTNQLLGQLIGDFNKSAKEQFAIGNLENAEYMEMLTLALAELLACRKMLHDLGYEVTQSPESIS